MRKSLLLIGSCWILTLGLVGYLYYDLSQSFSERSVGRYLDKLSQESDIGFKISFDKLKLHIKSECFLKLVNVQAKVEDKIVWKAEEMTIRLPYKLLFGQWPETINVIIDHVTIGDYGFFKRTVESYLDRRKKDATVSLSLPKHIVDSPLNLRINDVNIHDTDKDWKLRKLYFLNISPNKSSAFEVVMPIQQTWKHVQLSGDIVWLGEYRISPEKIDLHYFLKNKFQVEVGTKKRSIELSLEGKGFFHPKIGLFTTFSSKEDWIALVGDIEWTQDQFKVSLPKMAVSSEFAMDLLPFDSLRTDRINYTARNLDGNFSFISNDKGKDWNFDLKAKNPVTFPVLGKSGPDKRNFVFSKKGSTLLFNLGDGFLTIDSDAKFAKIHIPKDVFVPTKDFLFDPQLLPLYSYLTQLAPKGELGFGLGSNEMKLNFEQTRDEMLLNSDLWPGLKNTKVKVLYSVPQNMISQATFVIQNAALIELKEMIGEGPFPLANKFEGIVFRDFIKQEVKYKFRTRSSLLKWIPSLLLTQQLALHQDFSELSLENLESHYEVTTSQAEPLKMTLDKVSTKGKKFFYETKGRVDLKENKLQLTIDKKNRPNGRLLKQLVI